MTIRGMSGSPQLFLNPLPLHSQILERKENRYTVTVYKTAGPREKRIKHNQAPKIITARVY